MKVQVAPNGFAPVPPVRDANGATAQEFIDQQFEFEYCHECHNDGDKHTAVIGPFGGWFAFCNEPNAHPTDAERNAVADENVAWIDTTEHGRI